MINSLIYITLVVFLPFIFSFLSIFVLLFKKDSKSLQALGISYLFGIFFSLGALISLLFIVTTQDIAFGWATTLDISSKSLSNFLNSIAIWKSFCNNCIIDEHLAEISQIVRLGGSIGKEQIANAKELGSWWKFLFFSILIYGVLFRTILLIVTKVLQNMRKTKFVAEKNSENLKEFSNKYNNKINLKELKKREFKVIKYHTECDLNNNKNAKDIVICVKSWEPPILDFFDFLEEVQNKNKNSKISIYLVGLNGNTKEQDIDIWLKKLNELKLNYEIII